MGFFDTGKGKTMNVDGKCAYCTGRNIVRVSKQDRYGLRQKGGAPTHAKIDCGHCGNTFYLTKGRWQGEYFSGSGEEKARKTSPGKNVWVETI